MPSKRSTQKQSTRTRPSANTGMRLTPTTKEELSSLLGALAARGWGNKQDDLISVLLHRAAAVVGDVEEIDRLGNEMRLHRIAARDLGY
jgi:hypothetical protein